MLGDGSLLSFGVWGRCEESRDLMLKTGCVTVAVAEEDIRSIVGNDAIRVLARLLHIQVHDSKSTTLQHALITLCGKLHTV